MKLEDVLAHALQLPVESRRQLAQSLIDSLQIDEVRDAGVFGEYSDAKVLLRKVLTGMKSVTVVLPDDLVKRAQAAGLFADKRLEELLRRALEEQRAGTIVSRDDSARRRLVRQNGRLVVEAMPGEQPITDAEVRDLLNRMEW